MLQSMCKCNEKKLLVNAFKKDLDPLFPESEDLEFQFALIKVIECAARQRGIGKGEISKLVMWDQSDSLRTWNQCKQRKIGGAMRRFSIREAMRAAKVLDRPLWKIIVDAEFEVERKQGLEHPRGET